jgi:hypothetical protein
MIEVLLNLDFDCCYCGECIGVKLKCAGKGLAGGAHTVAAANVACPACEGLNLLCFEPCGVIVDVQPSPASQHILEPSLN